MPLATKISAIGLNRITSAEVRIQTWINSPIDYSIFRLLLRQVKAGLEVELALHEANLNTMDITRQYLENFMEAGGKVYYFNGNNKQRSFFLVDNESLIHEYSSSDKNGYVIGEISSPESIKKCRQQFKKIKENSLLLHPKKTLAKQEDADRKHRWEHVIEKPQINIAFDISPKSVEIGQAFELRWYVENASQVYINQGIGSVKRQGRLYMKAEKNTEFCLTAEEGNRKASSIASVQVNPAIKITYQLSTIDFLDQKELLLQSLEELPHHYSIVKGQLIKLYWRVYNADLVKIDKLGEVAHEGVHDFVFDELTMIRIEAKGEQGPSAVSIVVSVIEAPNLDNMFASLSKSMGQEIPTIEPLSIPNVDTNSIEEVLQQKEVNLQATNSRLWQRVQWFFGKKKIRRWQQINQENSCVFFGFAQVPMQSC